MEQGPTTTRSRSSCPSRILPTASRERAMRARSSGVAGTSSIRMAGGSRGRRLWMRTSSVRWIIAPDHGTAAPPRGAGGRPRSPLAVPRDHVGAHRLGPELPQERHHLAAMVGGMVADVLEELPEGGLEGLALEALVLDRLGDRGLVEVLEPGAAVLLDGLPARAQG